MSTLLYLSAPLVNGNEMKIYRWVDEEGKTHFSDTAVPGTDEVEVKENNLLFSDTVKVASADKTNDENHDKAVINYQVNITSPADNQALRSNNGNIDIHVAIEPAKKHTQTLQLYLDGKKLGNPQISPTIQVQNIDRGTHQVQVELLSKSGKVLAKTPIVTVHLQRTSIQ